MDPREFLQLYREVRSRTERLCEPLETEDYVIQTMPEVSPTRWHLAHTTWFWERFVLLEEVSGYETPEPAYDRLFNSYYRRVGEPWPRPMRGTVSRPTVREIFAYRRHVDRAIEDFLEAGPELAGSRLGETLEVGINHEEQHQELMLTDIKHVLAHQPTRPAYGALPEEPGAEAVEQDWVEHPGGEVEIGHAGGAFGYDNEFPRHAVLLEPFQLARRTVTNAEYRAFVEDGGYGRVELWLADGWNWVQENDLDKPLYWKAVEGGYEQYTLGGWRPLEPAEPVCHVSYYEADAYARWAGARLPLEEEWEVLAGEVGEGNFVEEGRLHPRPATRSTAGDAGLLQAYGDVWELTASPYVAYRGYRPYEGHLGEYNGKFMSNQWVLRGGSCATSRRHIRRTYRNFFYPHDRWQFQGFRLARS